MNKYGIARKRLLSRIKKEELVRVCCLLIFTLKRQDTSCTNIFKFYAIFLTIIPLIPTELLVWYQELL